MYSSVESIQEQMNLAARTGTPFLFAINYPLSEGFFVSNPMEQDKVLFNFNGVGNKKRQLSLATAPKITIHPNTMEQYGKKFAIVQQYIAAGRVTVVNLTDITPIQTTISPKEIFECSSSLYQLYVEGKFVCFSPEIFVQIKDGRIYTYPMKGTIDATIADAQQIILQNEKELDEHQKTVQAMCEDLSKVATNIELERFRYIDLVQTTTGSLLQTSSQIAGQLPDNYMSQMGDIIVKLLPGISIVGSPKEPSLLVIDAAEGISRGYYCGVAGYFDGKTLDTCVLIRFIDIDNDQLYFRSGGGITVHSDCEKEYRETLQKIYLTCK